MIRVDENNEMTNKTSAMLSVGPKVREKLVVVIIYRFLSTTLGRKRPLAFC